MKVILNPIKEIYINEIFLTSIENITRDQAVKGKNFLSWSNGYLFVLNMIDVDDLKKRQGDQPAKLFLESVCIAECKEYIPILKYNGFELDVLKSDSPMISDLIKCIVENKYDA